jgi:hypothetical protein
MDEVRKLSNSVCYTPSSESYRIYNYYIWRFIATKLGNMSLTKELTNKKIIMNYIYSFVCGAIGFLSSVLEQEPIFNQPVRIL